MSRLFSDGYELSSNTDNVEQSSNSGTVAIVTTPVRTGKYAGRANPVASTGFWRKTVFTSDRTIVGFTRVYLRIASYPSTPTHVIRYQNTANSTVGSVSLSTTGTLTLLKASGVAIGSASAVLSLDTWYRIEFKTDATGAGTLELSIDGSILATGANSLQGAWAKVTWGSISSCTTDLYFDDVAVNDTSGTAQNSYPGAGGIIHLWPTAAGDNTNWTRLGSGATNYSSLRQTPPDDSTTAVRSKTAGQIDDYNIDNSGLSVNDTINMAAVGVRYSGFTASTWSGFKVRVKAAAGGTVTESTEITPISTAWTSLANADPRVYPLTLYTLPGSASAWTNTDIDNAQIGLNLTTAATNDALVTSLWLQVDFSAGAPVIVNISNALVFFE